MFKQAIRPHPRLIPRDRTGSPPGTERGAGAAGERFLLFEVGGDHFGVAAAFLLEVALHEGIAAIGGTEGSECGAFSHRGFSIPALDLRALFNYPASPPAEEARVLIGEVAGRRMGLAVDRVAEIVELAPEAILAVPEGTSQLPSACFRGVVTRNECVVLLLEAAGLSALECMDRFGEAVAVPALGPGKDTP